MTLKKGSLELGRFYDVPVRIHWTAPIGAFLFGGLSFVPGFWLAFFVIILLHEAGHAVMVRFYRARVLAIEMTGFGGLCRWQGNVTPLQRSLIALGGVLAQCVLLVTTRAVVEIVGAPSTSLGLQIEHAFIWANLWLMLVNLLPVPPLDGAEAWKIGGRTLSEWRSRRAHRRTRMKTAQLAAMHRDLEANRLSPELEEQLHRIAQEAASSSRNPVKIEE